MEGYQLNEMLALEGTKIEGLDAPIQELAKVAVHLWHRIQRAPFAGILGQSGAVNVQGEEVQKLDEVANERIKSALQKLGSVAALASEEEADPVVFAENGRWLVCVDPLDGSSNIDVNVPIGTIFSIYERRRKGPVSHNEFLRPGREQVAAGYFMYGAALTLMISWGHGTHILTYDPVKGDFICHSAGAHIPPRGKIYSVNEGNAAHMPESIQRYLQHCKHSHTLIGKPYALRYIGSLIGDFHRNFLKGGIFLYPPTSPAPHGKLRLLYEGNPMAFLITQGGGMAIDGTRATLDIQPEHIHQRTPLYIGSAEMVSELLQFIQS